MDPQTRAHKRCALTNHAEPRARNSKRSHIVQAMAKKTFWGAPVKILKYLRGQILFSSKGILPSIRGVLFSIREALFSRREILLSRRGILDSRGDILFVKREHPVFEKGKSRGTRDQDHGTIGTIFVRLHNFTSFGK